MEMSDELHSLAILLLTEVVPVTTGKKAKFNKDIVIIFITTIF
jgi:hypothetical protein